MLDKMIWAPWRAGFILSKKEKGCVFCKRQKMKDSIRNLVLYRGRTVFVILNKYPYNSGHMMIVPYRHVAHLERLTPQEAIEFFDLTRVAVAIIKEKLRPHSLNLGMNLGRSAGAGVPGHLHMHIVPRWIGDTNFMPVIGKTSVVSIPLEPIYELLREGFDKI
ncbi:HIT family hydrolase [candidate division GN15 bacterium]|uniref:HIT family hydrolase n=1 Tax=candidate division GN15 bacterium TaxID=2072418 RepID=A0A855X2E4_9BACT|nr:MAG: HIT family hydrolase [candidate division GN15 bacterium]